MTDPSEVVKFGDKITVKVIGFKRTNDRHRISLSLNLYKPGQHLQGTVTQVVSGGCFVKIAKGVEGFIDKEIAINNDINVVVSHIDKKDRFIYVRL